MKNSKIYSGFIITVIVVFASCKPEKMNPVDVGYAYFPDTVGHWILYKVDSTWHDSIAGIDTVFHFKVRDSIESHYIDTSGRITQRIERQYMSDSVNWYMKRIWHGNLTRTTAERVEENIRYIKLNFPVMEGKLWNGNLYNDSGAQNYKETLVNQYYMDTVTWIPYPLTVTVIQIDSTNAVHRIYVKEIYAKNIGLIYREAKNLVLFPGGVAVQTGFEYTYRAIGHN